MDKLERSDVNLLQLPVSSVPEGVTGVAGSPADGPHRSSLEESRMRTILTTAAAAALIAAMASPAVAALNAAAGTPSSNAAGTGPVSSDLSVDAATRHEDANADQGHGHDGARHGPAWVDSFLGEGGDCVEPQEGIGGDGRARRDGVEAGQSPAPMADTTPPP